MKTIFVLFISLMASAAMAEDKIFTYYEEIQYGNDNQRINGYSDGYQTPDGYDGYSINFKIAIDDKDSVKSVQGQAFRGDEETKDFTCEVSKAVIRDGYAYFDIDAGVEDESDTCEYTVTTQKGKTAVVDFFEEGT